MAYFLSCADWLFGQDVFCSDYVSQGSDEALKEKVNWDLGFLEDL